MALQLAFTDANSGAVLPAAYFRINGFSVDTVGQGLTAHFAVYYDKASYDAGKAPMGSFNADLSAAYASVYAAAPTEAEAQAATAELLAARAYAVVKTQSDVVAGPNTFDFTKATDV